MSTKARFAWGTAAGLALAAVLVSPLASASAQAVASPAHRTSPALGWSTATVADAEALARTIGVAPAALSAYAPFTQPFPQEWADAAVRMVVPLVLAWEPWDWDLPVGQDQPAFSLASIARGDHDAYARTWAAAAAASGARILLRFAPEMNGDWNPWSIGDTPADFRNAWRHLHRIFDEAGAGNVAWVFNPSVDFAGARPMSAFWPGADQVDWLALDGYTWQGVLAGRPYESVSRVFSRSLAQLRGLATGLPVMIAECAAGPQAKDSWIPDLARTAPLLGISLVVWFDHVKETDWRLESAHLSRPLPSLLQQAGWRIPTAGG